MLYFDLANFKEELLSDKEQKMPKFIKNIIYNFRKITGQALKINIDGKNLIVLPNLTKRTLKKVDKILKIDVTKNVCISNELIIKEDFVKFLNLRNINIFDGRWLFKYLMLDSLEYVCEKSGVDPEYQEISILTNENTPFISESIKRLSEKVKNITIVSKREDIFKKIEKEIYEENGLIIRVTKDFKRAALKSSIVLNLNFVQEDLNKVRFQKDAILINFESKLKVNQKSFEGKICDFYHINLPTKYLENLERFDKFESNNLYESFIYKKTMPQNIWKEIERDKIKIVCLEGRNGIIKFPNLDMENKKVKI